MQEMSSARSGGSEPLNRSHGNPSFRGYRKCANRFSRLFTLLIAVLMPALAIAAAPKTVLFYGDSLTAGYGLDPDEAYPALVEEKAAKAGTPIRAVNAGLSGETTSGGLRRLDWILRQKVDIFVIELGGNDGLRGISPDVTRRNLAAMIQRVREKNPGVTVVLAGMQIPTNMGRQHADAFASIYPEVAKEHDVVLIPFLLEGVGGIPELNLPDGIHPTAEGHRIVAETVWKYLQPLVK
jgi:acyl-CoA thioesterase I